MSENITTTVDTTARELTPELLDLMDHEKVIEQGLASFIDVGNSLLAIKAGKKYQAAGYSTFEDYCSERWHIGSSQRSRLMIAAATVESLVRDLPESSPIGELLPLPANEAQVRPLTRLPEPERAPAWAEAVERAGGEQPTAREVEDVVNERRNPAPPPDPAPAPADPILRTPQAVPKPAPKVNGERVEGAPPHPAVYSDAVLDAFRELLDEHHNGPGGATICDPFAGTGRIHELQKDGWSTIGVELEAEWANLHEDTICGDSRDLSTLVYDAVQCEIVDVIATSPAYGNRLADHYNAYDPQARRSYSIDLGRPLSDGSGAALQWGVDYRSLHETVWGEAVDLLAPGGLFLLNCKNHQRSGAIEQVIAWHMRSLIELGLRVIDEREIAPAGLANTTAAKLPERVIAFRKPVTP